MRKAGDTSSASDEESLSAINAEANVAIDMFADEDRSKSQKGTDAAYEFMIWLGSCGSPQPLGYSESSGNYTQELGGTNL